MSLFNLLKLRDTLHIDEASVDDDDKALWVSWRISVSEADEAVLSKYCHIWK